MRVLVEPEADRVLWLHVRVLPVRDMSDGRRSQIARRLSCLLDHIAGKDRLRDPKL
jgi:hypothetical protein